MTARPRRSASPNRQRSESDIEALLETIARVVGSELDLQKILKFVSGEIARLLPYDRFALSTSQPDGSLCIEFVDGVPVPGHEVGKRFQPSPDVAVWPKGHEYHIETSRQKSRSAQGGLSATNLQSSLVVPVGDPAAPIALLGVHSLKREAYAEPDAMVFRRVADQIAPAIRNARLYRDTARLAEQSAALAKIGRSAAEVDSVQAIFQTVYEQLGQMMSFDRFVIGLWSADLKTFSSSFVKGVEIPGLPEGARTQVPHELFSRPRLDDFESEQVNHPFAIRMRKASADAGLRSVALVPLKAGQELVGLLSVRSKAPHAYNRADLALLGRVADQIAPAVRRIQILEAARREAAERQAIATIGVIANSQLQIGQVFERAAQEIARLVPYDRLSFATVDRDGKVQMAYVTGVPLDGWEAGTVHSVEPLVTVLSVNEPPRATASKEEAASTSEAVERAGLKSWIQVPLGDATSPVGYLSVRSLQPDAYTDEHARVMELVAAQVVPAVKNAQLYERTVALASEARLLADISRAATAGLDIPALAVRFLEMVRTRVPFDRGVLRMVDASTGGLGAGAAVGIGADLPLPMFRSRTVTEAVALGRLVVESDAEPEEPSIAAPLAQLGLRSSVTLPLISDEHVVGVVTLRRLVAKGFVQDEVEFLSRASAQIAPAVDNARLLAEISTLASTVENSPDFICSADLESRIQYLNGAGRGMVGLATDYDITQLTWDDFFGPEDASRLKDVAIPSALSRGSWHGELKLKTRDGSAIPVESIVVPIYHRNGALLGVNVSARNIADRKRAEEELHTLATTDTLTGLLNRRQFMLMLDQAVKLATRRRAEGTLVYLDLDGFKYVNDTHGHTAGDDLLVAIGKTLKANVRSSDVVARTGGDEFVVILHDAPPQEGLRKATQLVNAVADTLIEAGADRVNTSCSAGVVGFPIPDATADDLVAFADLAMYRAKDAGRNRAHAYDPSEGGRELVSGLQRTRRMILDALAGSRVRLYRQPIVDVVTRQVVMYEVLVRLADFEGRLFSPMEFIPQAETLDVVHLIDQRVVDLAFLRWRVYADAGQRLRLSINLSGRSLDADMSNYIIEAGKRHEVEPAAIAFEITETATWRGGAQTEAFARALSDVGYKMSIDDFGSGATSFKQIRSLPFHFLKLDGSLVENLKEGRHDRDLVRSLSGLAHTLGVEVVAEYVQDEETMKFLQACGIEYAQGYFVGRPTEFEETPRT